MFRRILPYIGPTGLDFLVGTYGHAIGKAYDQLHIVNPTDDLRLIRLRSPLNSDLQSSRGAQVDLPDQDGISDEDGQAGIPLPSPCRRRQMQARASSAAASIYGDNDAPSWKGPRKLIYALTSICGVLSSLPTPLPPAIDSPIADTTPFTVGCALPSKSRPSLTDIIHTLRQFGNRAQLVVLPETALSLHYVGDKTYAADEVQRNVSEQYGTYVALSTESPGNRGKMRNEVTLVGPHRVIGTYAKRSLFPSESFLLLNMPTSDALVIESHRFQKGDSPPPVWRLDLSQ